VDKAHASQGGDCRFIPASSALLAKPWVAVPNHSQQGVAVRRRAGVLHPSRKSPGQARSCVLARGTEAPICDGSVSDGQSARGVRTQDPLQATAHGFKPYS
jgi:hypothetical protein